MSGNIHKDNSNQVEKQKEDGSKRLKSLCSLTLSFSTAFAFISALPDFKVSKLAISAFFMGLVIPSAWIKYYLESHNHFFSKKIRCLFTLYLFSTFFISPIIISYPMKQIMSVHLKKPGIKFISPALKFFTLDRKDFYLLAIGFFLLATLFFGITATRIYSSDFSIWPFIVFSLFIPFVASYSPFVFIVLIICYYSLLFIMFIIVYHYTIGKLFLSFLIFIKNLFMSFLIFIKNLLTSNNNKKNNMK